MAEYAYKDSNGLMISVLESRTKDQDTSLAGKDMLKERTSEDMAV